ncbi:MAG: N-formylglutamate amidohydrolase [Candidatus Woesearchaeota archaeon]
MEKFIDLRTGSFEQLESLVKKHGNIYFLSANSEISDTVMNCRHNYKFIVAVPHSGALVPYELLPYFENHNKTIEILFSEGIDHYSEQIYALMPQGGTLVYSLVNRFFGDKNRLRNDTSDTGVLRTKDFEGRTIRSVEFPLHIKEKLLTRFYDPFHMLLRYLVKEKLKNSGYSFVINGHTMQECEGRPVFYIGTADGASYPFTDEFCNALESSIKNEICIRESLTRFSSIIELNTGLYKGQGITSMYHKPEEGMFAILCEVNQGLYMNKHITKNERAADMFILERIRESIGIATLQATKQIEKNI